MRKEVPLEGEEIIEMGEGKDGKFYPVAVVKSPFSLPRQRMPAFYQFLDGLNAGFDSLDRLFDMMARVERRQRR